MVTVASISVVMTLLIICFCDGGCDPHFGHDGRLGRLTEGINLLLSLTQTPILMGSPIAKKRYESNEIARFGAKTVVQPNDFQLVSCYEALRRRQLISQTGDV